MRRTTTAAALGVAIAVAAGCASDPTAGYSTKSAFPADVRTIAVPIVENDTFVRGVEFDLTDALIKEIEARTPYRVTTPDRADSILTAHIREVTQDSLSKSPETGLGEENIVSLTIDFRWTNLTSLSDIVARERFTGHALYAPSAPIQERIELGRFAAVQGLARDVVSTMQAAW